VYSVTSESHPSFYIHDIREAYQVGSSLDGETFEGPFTEQPLLADWAGVRNLHWNDSKTDWRLFLDADDVVEKPEVLPRILVQLEARHVDLAASRYVFGRSEAGAPNSVTFRERLTRNTSTISWVGKVHEILLGDLRRVALDDVFQVIDCKDNWGKGVRAPGRNFKVLYRQARLEAWKLPPRHLALLIQESNLLMPLSWIKGSLWPAYQRTAIVNEEIAWVACMVGEQCEAAGKFQAAHGYFKTATFCYPSAKAAFRLCRACFHLGDWKGCIKAFDMGVGWGQNPAVLDLGPVYAHSSKVLVAHAYQQLGNNAKARELISEAVKVLPPSSVLQGFHDLIFRTTEGNIG
jgi:tetratricopeptide (TPR) repeat protein